jgi:putative flippase GtrA
MPCGAMFLATPHRSMAGRLATRAAGLRDAYVAPLLDIPLLRQGLRFVLAGGTVATVYLLTTTLLSVVVGAPFQVALAVGFFTALAVHFTLQRGFVWAREEEYALPLHHQVGRYLIVCVTQYGVTATSTALLPGVLGLPTEVVYLVTVISLLPVNFVIFRLGIFHPEADVPPETDAELLASTLPAAEPVFRREEGAKPR